jgi:anti-sigma regulatory factor (Ser/Thr protein kinase)
VPGKPAPRPAGAGGFAHETFFYRETGEFVTGVAGFARGGLAADEVVVVAAPRPRVDAVRDALAGDAARVQFLDMAEVGGNPARIIAVWAAALDTAIAAGRGLRGVGEPAFAGRRPAELVECQLHELLLNEAFDPGPAWRLVCPYDESALPPAVCAGARRAHPVCASPGGRAPSSDFDHTETLAAFAEPLPRPLEGGLRGTFGPYDVPALRHTVATFARSCGLGEERVEALQLAASELASNSIRHGGGTGEVALWLEPGAAVIEVSDGGEVTDPLTGRRHPPVEQEGGRGVWLVNQLCDLVQLRSSPAGTTVRVTTWL